KSGIDRRLIVATSYISGPSEGILQAGDEIIAMDGYHVAEENDLKKRIQRDHSAGDTIRLHIFRRGALQEKIVVLRAAPFNVVRIAPKKSSTPAQHTAFTLWTGRDWPAVSPPTDNPGA
ncbi:MAG: PDZ domain-containing protein, partial [Firmicutes bacterium]|nr:PDZ domain-containing protein [Bacillota bacterium]